jgi:hypothetical protein
MSSGDGRVLHALQGQQQRSVLNDVYASADPGPARILQTHAYPVSAPAFAGHSHADTVPTTPSYPSATPLGQSSVPVVPRRHVAALKTPSSWRGAAARPVLPAVLAPIGSDFLAADNKVTRVHFF